MASFTFTVPDAAVPRIQAAVGTDVKAVLIDYLKSRVVLYETRASSSLAATSISNEWSGVNIT